MLERKRTYRTAFIPAVLLCMLFSNGIPAFANPPVASHAGGSADSTETSRSKILSVLETRTADEKVVAKAAEKLLTLHGRKLRLMASLCDRIEADEGSAGADIAFSIVMALIILS